MSIIILHHDSNPSFNYTQIISLAQSVADDVQHGIRYVLAINSCLKSEKEFRF